MPTVSVIIPVFNQEKYIEECVNSVLEQTYKNYEIIVVDDGSTDKTPKILKKFGAKIRYIRQDNKGASAALNKGIKSSKGRYLAWLSSDDLYLPEKLNLQIDYFDRHPEVSLVYTDFLIINEFGKILKEVKSPHFSGKKEFILNMIRGNFINGSSVVFKKECVGKVGLFDEEMKLHADGNMWFRMLKHYKFGHVPKILLKYRHHGSMASKNLEEMKRFRYIHFERFFDLYKLNDIFSKPKNLATKNFLSNSNSELGLILLKRGLPRLAYQRFLLALGDNPFNVKVYTSPFVYFFSIIKRKLSATE